MINGIQKHLLVALSAVFLWGFSVTASAQELEKTVLPMEAVHLVYKDNSTLITKKYAEQLDKVIQHMRSKPDMRINIEYFFNEKLKARRLKNVAAYLVDNGVDKAHLLENMLHVIICDWDCFGTIIISEISE